MRKLICSGAITIGMFLMMQSTATALPCDARGSNWRGEVRMGADIWGLELRRQTCAAGSLWNYYMWTATGKKMQGQARVGLNGRAISVFALNGAALRCTLSGTYARADVTNGFPPRGSGNASCPGAPAGTWRASFR